MSQPFCLVCNHLGVSPCDGVTCGAANPNKVWEAQTHPDPCHFCWTRLGGQTTQANGASKKWPYQLRLATPCKHLGPETGEKHDCTACGGGKQIPVRSCSIYGKCTWQKKLRYRDPTGAYIEVPWCVTCKEYQASDPFGVKPVRHLLCHLWPLAVGRSVWLWHVGQLKRRAHIFNGKRIVAVAADRDTDPVGDVERALGPDFEIILLPNQPRFREVFSFDPLFSRVASTDPREMVFWCHGKGVRNPGGLHIRQWASIMYEAALDYLPLVEGLLATHGVVGSFRRTHKAWQDDGGWHYSGSYFWARSMRLFSRNWRHIPMKWYGMEAYPGVQFRHDEAAVLFRDSDGDPGGKYLYDPDYMRGTVLPEWERGRDRHREYRTEGVRK